jgi:hypothetical protein
MVQVTAEMLGKKGMCTLYGKLKAILASQRYGSGRRGNNLYQADGSSELQEQPISGPTMALKWQFLEF